MKVCWGINALPVLAALSLQDLTYVKVKYARVEIVSQI